MYKAFTQVFTEQQMAALAREADERHPQAQPVVAERYQLLGERLASAASFRFAATGSELDILKASGLLKRIFHDDFGLDVEPVTSSYNYYGMGDHIGIHRDAPECRYAALITLSRGIQPLDVYPDLATSDARELYERIRSGRLGTPVRVPLPHGGVVIIRGSVLPHARPPATRPCRVATVCFG